MEKNNLQKVSKRTDVVRARVTPKEMKRIEKIAAEYFDGSISDTVRYALHNCDFTVIKNGGIVKSVGKTLTSLPKKLMTGLARLHSDYQGQNHLLLAIGNNLNQIARHVNAQAISHSSPVTEETARLLAGIKKNMDSIRTTNGKMWARIKNIV